MVFSQKNTRKSLILFSTVIGLLLIGGFGGLAYFWWIRNAHVVIPFHVYRSAQLTPKSLEHVIQRNHIKTVINLRGAQPDAKWYRDERNLTAMLGVQHYDIGLSAHGTPSQKQLQKLVSFLLRAKEPILIHCLAGADRSGLASAIALILDKNASLKESRQQFSVWHFVVSDTSIGKITFSYYQRWLNQYQLKSTRQNFIDWVFSKEPWPNPTAPAEVSHSYPPVVNFE